MIMSGTFCCTFALADAELNMKNSTTGWLLLARRGMKGGQRRNQFYTAAPGPALFRSVSCKRAVKLHRAVHEIGHVLQQAAAQAVLAARSHKVGFPCIALRGGEVAARTTGTRGCCGAGWDEFC